LVEQLKEIMKSSVTTAGVWDVSDVKLGEIKLAWKDKGRA
jgi:hypothetical protein